MQPKSEHGEEGQTDNTSKDKEEKEKLTVIKIFDALTKKFPLVPALEFRTQATDIARSDGPQIWKRIVQKISEVSFKSKMFY